MNKDDSVFILIFLETFNKMVYLYLWDLSVIPLESTIDSKEKQRFFLGVILDSSVAYSMWERSMLVH